MYVHMYVWYVTCVLGANLSQKKAQNTLELELKMAVRSMWVPGFKPEFSAKAANALHL